MKQHITVEQLNELSEKGKEKLRKWWKPQDTDLVWNWKNKGEPEINHACNYQEAWDSSAGSDGYGNCFPLLSIGQMIEFLDDKRLHVPYNNDNLVEFFGVSKYGLGHWYVGVDGSDELASTDHIRLELCDALWEAVKEVLEK